MGNQAEACCDNPPNCRKGNAIKMINMMVWTFGSVIVVKLLPISPLQYMRRQFLHQLLDISCCSRWVWVLLINASIFPSNEKSSKWHYWYKCVRGPGHWADIGELECVTWPLQWQILWPACVMCSVSSIIIIMGTGSMSLPFIEVFKGLKLLESSGDVIIMTWLKIVAW